MNNKNSPIKIFGAIMIIVGTMIGAGILALPIITAKLGFFVGTLLILAIWLVMTYTALVITDISCSMPYGSSFKSIAERYLGKAGGTIAFISFVVLMYFISTAYISAAASSINATFSGVSKNIGAVAFVLIFGSIVVLGTKFVDYANRFFIILKIVLIIFLCFIFTKYINLENLMYPPVDFGASLVLAIPVFTTSFTSHIIVPTLSDYLQKNSKDMKRVIIIGSVIPLILYILWIMSILGALPLYGDISFMNSIFKNTPVADANIGDILKTVSSKIQTESTDFVLHIFTYVAIMTSFLSVNLSLFHFNLDTFKLNKLKSKPKAIITAAALTFLIPILINQLNPDIFIYAMTCVGLSIAVLLMIMPAMIARKKSKLNEPFNYKLSEIKSLWLCSFIIGWAVIACVFI